MQANTSPEVFLGYVLAAIGNDWEANAAKVKVLSGLSLLLAPALCVYALWFYLRRPLPPQLLPAIPLVLSSVSLQVMVAAMSIVSGFKQIAMQKAAGLSAVTGIFLDIRHAVLLRFMEVAACVVLLAVFKMLLKHATHTEVAIDTVGLTPATTLWAAVATSAVSAIIWFYADMVMVDPARAAEARARLVT